MSAATGLAALAGALAGAAIADLAATGAVGRRSRPRRGRPFRTGRRALVGLLAGAGRGLGAPAPPHGLADRLAAAGRPVSAPDLMALKAGGALAALLAAVPLVTALPGALGLTVPAAAAAAAYLAPEVWLRRRAAARARRMAEELADVADLLRVAVDAGLSIRRALAEVGRRHPGLLAAELRRTAEALELGVPRRTAIDALRRRVPLGAAGGLLAALDRAERLGAPPAEALAALAADARAGQRRAVAERAARAAPQVQLAVALLLVPSVLLLVAAALAPALGG